MTHRDNDTNLAPLHVLERVWWEGHAAGLTGAERACPAKYRGTTLAGEWEGGYSNARRGLGFGYR